MEKLELRRSSSQAKSVGTIVSVAGAMIVTLYKGPALLMAARSPSNNSPYKFLVSQLSNWVFGGILLAINCFVSAIWNIYQVTKS